MRKFLFYIIFLILVLGIEGYSKNREHRIKKGRSIRSSRKIKSQYKRKNKNNSNFKNAEFSNKIELNMTNLNGGSSSLNHEIKNISLTTLNSDARKIENSTLINGKYAFMQKPIPDKEKPKIDPLKVINENFETPAIVKKLTSFAKAQVEYLNDPTRKLLNTVEDIESKTIGSSYIEKPIFSSNVIDSSLTNIFIPQYSISNENKDLWKKNIDKKFQSVSYPGNKSGDLHQDKSQTENSLTGIMVPVLLVPEGNQKANELDQKIDASFNGVINDQVRNTFYETKNESTYLPDNHENTTDFRFEVKTESRKDSIKPTQQLVNPNPVIKSNMRFIMVN